MSDSGLIAIIFGCISTVGSVIAAVFVLTARFARVETALQIRAETADKHLAALEARIARVETDLHALAVAIARSVPAGKG